MLSIRTKILMNNGKPRRKKMMKFKNMTMRKKIKKAMILMVIIVRIMTSPPHEGGFLKNTCYKKLDVLYATEMYK